MLGVIIGHVDLALDKVERIIRTQEPRSNPQGCKAFRGHHAAASGLCTQADHRPVVLDLNDAVEGMLKMIQRLIGETSTLPGCPEQICGR